VKPGGCEARAAEFSRQPQASLAWKRGNPLLRSVDSEPLSHVIEPRKSQTEEAAVVPLAAAASNGALQRVPFGSSGVEGACAWRQEGFAGTWEIPAISTDSSAASGWPRSTTPRPGDVRRSSHGSKATGATAVPPSEGRRSAAGRMAGSLSVRVVPMKPGQFPSKTTRRREGGRLNMEPAPGPTPDASTFKRVSTQG
jgi:hypothetical protein